MRTASPGPFQAVKQSFFASADITVTAGAALASYLTTTLDLSPLGGVVLYNLAIQGDFAAANAANFVQAQIRFSSPGVPNVVSVFYQDQTPTTERVRITASGFVGLTPGVWTADVMMSAAAAPGTNFVIAGNTNPTNYYLVLETWIDASGQARTDEGL